MRIDPLHTITRLNLRSSAAFLLLGTGAIPKPRRWASRQPRPAPNGKIPLNFRAMHLIPVGATPGVVDATETPIRRGQGNEVHRPINFFPLRRLAPEAHSDERQGKRCIGISGSSRNLCLNLLLSLSCTRIRLSNTVASSPLETTSDILSPFPGCRINYHRS